MSTEIQYDEWGPIHPKTPTFDSLPLSCRIIARLFGLAYLVLWPLRLVVMLAAAPLFLLFLGLDWLMKVCFVNYWGPAAMFGGFESWRFDRCLPK